MKTYNPKKSGNVIYVINNDVNKAISRLHHESAPLLKELKMKRFFVTNSEKRRRRLKEAISRERIRQRKAELYA
jgi:ribosomal protein S21